ncbi:MAG: DUF4199 domain-containing protein [Bacteroidota bacterium]
MSRLIIVYGIIAGAIVVGIMFLGGFFMGDPEHLSEPYGMLIGFASMILSFSTIFVAIRSYKMQFAPNDMTFLKGLQIGLLITVVASLIYVAGWMYYSSVYAPDFMENYVQAIIEEYDKSDASPEEKAAHKEQLISDMELYNTNPLYKMFITFTEIFPVGLIISLIAAPIFMSRKK